MQHGLVRDVEGHGGSDEHVLRLPIVTIVVRAELVLAAAFMAAASAAVAQDVRPVIVDVQDLRFASQIGEDGPYDAGIGTEELLVVLHDGTLDFFDEGRPASPALAAFASEGIASDLIMLVDEHGAAAQSHMLLPSRVGGRFDGTNALVGWGPPPPIFDPSKHRYLSFLMRLYPSDDAFVGNDDPMQYEIFDGAGRFVGPIVVDVRGGDVLDAGVKSNEEQNLMWLDRSGLEPNDDWQRTEEDVVRTHPGFNGSVANPDATPVRVLAGETYLEPVPNTPRVLRHMRFDPALTDFKRPGSSLLRMRITSGAHQGWAGSYFNPLT